MADEADQPGATAESIFLAALERPSAERAAYVAGACGHDQRLRRRVEALLRAHEAPEGFLPEEGVASPTGSPTLARFLTAQLTEQPGDTIGRYKLREKLGEGGCGIVYLAEQEVPVKRKVALKIIKLGMDTKQVVARFDAERQALALMDHPNIARVLDAGATETGRPYFVMELVGGVRITDYCDQHQLTIRQRLDLFVQVCRAIQHAHQKGVIHRDIKPSNVLVAEQDGIPVPKVIDFGIAKATQGRLTDQTVFTAFEQFLGTPAYMSPEQAQLGSLDVDTRSDIYSLGVLLYELLTGKTPFDTKELLRAGLDAMRRTILEREPPTPSTRLKQELSRSQRPLTPSLSPDGGEGVRRTGEGEGRIKELIHRVRGDLDWIVMKCLEKDRARRYETANGLASDLQRHLNNEPVIARPPSNFYRLQKLVWRNRLAFAATGVVVVALVLGLATSTWMFFKEKAASEGLEIQSQRADAEARRAVTAAAEAKMSLSASDFLQAIRLIEQDEATKALPFLVRSLRNNPTNDTALVRLATLLTYHKWLFPILVLEHGADVNSAYFSPDGKRVVTASSDGTARVWDAETGQPLIEPLKHGDIVCFAEFSPDGKSIVTASRDKTARVWDAQTGQPITEPMKHSDTVWTAKFSPDGRRIVTASSDRAARVWDAFTGQPLTGRLVPDGGPVKFAQFSPDGERIVTVAEGSTRVWDARTGQFITNPIFRGTTLTPSVLSAQFSPDGKSIVIASFGNKACVVDAQTGQPRTTLEHSGVESAQFSPDGKSIVTASRDNTARVWDAQTGQPLIGPLKHGDMVRSAQISPDGRRVVTASRDNTARVWDAQTGQPLTEPLKHEEQLQSAQFSPDGNRIITTSISKTVRLWDTRPGQPLTVPMKHGDLVLSAEFSSDSRRVVTASGDNTARVWDAQTGQPLTEPLKHGDVVLSAQFSPDGRSVLTASFDKTARVWDAQTGQPLTKPLEHDDVVGVAKFSPDGKSIVTASVFTTVRVWDARTGQVVTELPTNEQMVRSVEFSPNSKTVVTASSDATARVWDARTGQPITEPMKHADKVDSARFSPDGKHVVTASSDATARVWDARTGQPITEPMKHGDKVWSAQFSLDGKRIVTASQDKTTRVWDAQTGQPLTEPLKHVGAWGGVGGWAQFSPDGNRVVTASSDTSVRVWDVRKGHLLMEPLKHEERLPSAQVDPVGGKRSFGKRIFAQFSPDGRRIVTASWDHTACVWDVAPTNTTFPEWLLELSEAISGQVLNSQGLLEPTRSNTAEVLQRIREKLNELSDDDDWVVWGRWFFADPATRTISPFSKVTVPEYIQNRLREAAEPTRPSPE